MAEIDVDDVLIDPDIAGDSFVVIRRQEVVDNFGISSTMANQVTAYGAVQPTGDNSVIRSEDYDAQGRGLKIITAFRLRGVVAGPGAATWKPDQILWKGSYYEVRSLEDFTQFGGGFVEAECVQIDYVGPPPSQLPPYVGRLDFSNSSNSGEGGGAGGCA
jgi:hypothetical protein